MAKSSPKTGGAPKGNITKTGGKPTYSMEKHLPKGAPKGVCGAKGK